MAIGETFLGAVLQVVFDRLASRELIDFFKHSKIDKSLVNKLKTLMLATEKLLADAEYKQLTDRAVELWLLELKHWFYRAEEVVDEINTEVLRLSVEEDLFPEPQSLGAKVRNLIPAINRSSTFAKSITLKITEVVDMIESMLSQKDALGLREIVSVKVPLRLPSTCLLEVSRVYGRDGDREKLLDFLVPKDAVPESNRVSVAALVGMGGLGKTTLARLIYNDESLNGSFVLKAWVCVSDEFDIVRVTKSIIESISGSSSSNSQDLNVLQLELSGKLREKKFLLVLDDVWNENYSDWECLQTPFNVGAPGSKIIVTTRNEGVASVMCNAPVFFLSRLSVEDDWSLLSAHAFGVGNSTPNQNLELIGRHIAEKCRGLPLAIKTLGRLLRSTQDIRDWQAILDSSIWDLPPDKSNVAPALWVSYYHLPSYLKRCFSYCAIYPKDYEFDKITLVLLWIAENLVQPSKKKRRMEDIGEEYFNMLLSRSFFEQRGQGKSKFIMHDLLHDLAQAVAGEFVARQEIHSVVEVSRRTRQFVLNPYNLNPIARFHAANEAKSLRAFLSHGNPDGYMYILGIKILSQLLSQCYCLRVLTLPNCQILILPESIGNLKQLRYLDFSYNSIKELPQSVSRLYNLHVLLLSYCRSLTKLPVDMSRLVSLSHLDITETKSLVQMPQNMSKLTGLQTLTGFIVGKQSGASLRELGDLSEICGTLALRRLQNVTDAQEAFDAKLSRKEHIKELALEFDTSDSDESDKERRVLENLKPHLNLSKLTIKNYAGTRFPNWLDAGCSGYINLTFLCLTGCKYCMSLPSVGRLPYLKELVISGLRYVTAVEPDFYGNNSSLATPFPALESLQFIGMKTWEVWPRYEVEGGRFPFPCLKKLLLEDCPNLKGDVPVHLPSLEELGIRGCEQLSCSLPQLPSIHVLSLAAWRNLELASVYLLTTVTSLKLSGLDQLVNLPVELASLLSLRELCISNCDNLESLANTGLSPQLELLSIDKCGALRSLADIVLPLKLEKIDVSSCEALVSLPKAMVLLAHLKEIMLSGCPNLKSAPGDTLPISIQYLHVSSCENWELPLAMERMHLYSALEVVILSDMGGCLVSFPLGMFPNLQSVILARCRDLEKVFIPDEVGSHNLVTLRILHIRHCPKLEIIGKATASGTATVLPAPNLRTLCILGCEKAKPLLADDTHDSEHGFPSNPKHLMFDFYGNMTSQWSPRSLFKFSNLINLRMYRHSAEVFPNESCVLPNTLTMLAISWCPKLRFLDGKALQALTSLKDLELSCCPELKCLPEEPLPPSLGYLYVENCPLLKERCKSDSGTDWSKIHHIPHRITPNDNWVKDCQLPKIKGRVVWLTDRSSFATL